MSMMNYDGTTRYVWNPYSLQELESILSVIQLSGRTRLEEYLYCVATGGTCEVPSTPIFDRQQVMHDGREPVDCVPHVERV